MVLGQVAGTLARGCDLEAAAPGPVDVFADQGRLVAPGEAVDHPCSCSFLSQQRPDQRIGLDVDHDDMMACSDGSPAMCDTGPGYAGGFDDDVQWLRPGQGIGVRSQPGAATGEGRTQ